MRRLFATVAYSCIAILSVCAEAHAQSAIKRARVSYLSEDKIFPLFSEHCSCMTFPQDAQLTDKSIIFSATPYIGNIRLNNKDYQLPHKSRTNDGERYTNILGEKDILVSLEMVQVSYKQVCSAYPDPPTHGSCFTGKMRIDMRNRVASIPVIQLCGC
jgi:hypothetical protein